LAPIINSANPLKSVNNFGPFSLPSNLFPSKRMKTIAKKKSKKRSVNSDDEFPIWSSTYRDSSVPRWLCESRLQGSWRTSLVLATIGALLAR
jgi:hypothetical protein